MFRIYTLLAVRKIAVKPREKVSGKLAVLTAYCFHAKQDVDSTLRLVWRSGNGVRHINEVTLHRAQLVLGLTTTFGGSIIPVFIQVTQAHSAWPSLRGCNEYRRWFRPSLERNGASEVTTLRRFINQFIN